MHDEEKPKKSGKVTKLRLVSNRVKKVLGLPYTPEMTMDRQTVRRIIMQSDLFQAWNRIHNNSYKSVQFVWDEDQSLTVSLLNDEPDIN